MKILRNRIASRKNNGADFKRFNQHNTNGIIRYNGTNFDTLESGLDDHEPGGTTVSSMQMFQNKLYVFGGFVKTGKYYCSSMDRWNGSSWDTISYLRSGGIHLSDMYNNELYVAGQFDSIGGIECNSIAKFDGTNWHCLGYPYKDVDFTAIKNFQGKLYMAGQVNPQTSLANLSYWDGVQWIPWVGVTGTQYKYIAGMTVIDSMLYVYGRFDNIAGTNAKE